MKTWLETTTDAYKNAVIERDELAETYRDILYDEWVRHGKPGGNFEYWLNYQIVGA